MVRVIFTTLITVALVTGLGGCKDDREKGVSSFRYLTEEEKQILNEKLSQLVTALQKENIPAVRELMHSSRRSEFTIQSLRQVEAFRTPGWFKNYMGRPPHSKPSIVDVRNARDQSLVKIEGLGVMAFFKEIDGTWYFDGWAK